MSSRSKNELIEKTKYKKVEIIVGEEKKGGSSLFLNLYLKGGLLGPGGVPMTPKSSAATPRVTLTPRTPMTPRTPKKVSAVATTISSLPPVKEEKKPEIGEKKETPALQVDLIHLF